ncbi:MAG: NAD-dependent epimerase/dehydratase family protein [Planctomycetota bacterium]
MILLTGATGFLGRRVLRTMAGQNWIVRPLVRDEDKYRASFPGGPGPLVGDFCNFKKGDLAEERFGEFVHLASEVWPVDRKDISQFRRVNVDGSRAILAALDPKVINIVVLASTVSVYGNMRGPIHEQCASRPNNAYAESKREQELIFLEFGARHNIPVIILRFSSIYGPGQFPGTVLPLFLDLALHDRTLTITGPPDRLQNFIFVDDAARAVALSIDKTAGGVFNIASKKETTLRTLAAAILKTTGARAHAIERSKPDAAPAESFHIETSKAERELEWSPRYDLESGLIQTLAEMQQ